MPSTFLSFIFSVPTPVGQLSLIFHVYFVWLPLSEFQTRQLSFCPQLSTTSSPITEPLFSVWAAFISPFCLSMSYLSYLFHLQRGLGRPPQIGQIFLHS